MRSPAAPSCARSWGSLASRRIAAASAARSAIGYTMPSTRVGHDLGGTAGVWDEHGAARAERLDDDLAEGLGLRRGVHEDVGVSEEPRDVLDEPAELDARPDAEGVGERPEGRCVVVLAEERGTRDAQHLVGCAEGIGERLDGEVLALPRREPPERW